MERSFSTLEALQDALQRQGCQYALVKLLATNQDNEKNQIYLGAERGLSQLLPGTLGVRGASHSTQKRHSSAGRFITELRLDFAWVWPDMHPVPAPSTRLIDYFQYAAAGETRLSGFLKACPRAPRALRRNEMDAYGRRVLIVGVAEAKTFGAVITDQDGPQLVDQISRLPPAPGHPVVRLWKLGPVSHVLDPEALLSELRAIAGQLHPACTLRNAGSAPEPQRALQGGGWTLEAHLGIPRNSISGPDKYGFEIKAVSGSKVTLITTEPDSGARAEDFVGYLKRFGWESPERPGHWVFNGAHSCNRPNTRTHATLMIEHWDHENNCPKQTGEPRVMLVHTPSEQVISAWSFTRLAQQWNKKHAGAAYVQTTGFPEGERPPAQYRYGPRVCVGIGTSVMRFLQHIASTGIHLDPGDSLCPAGQQKRRTQWRVQGPIYRRLPERLQPLYYDFNIHQLS